MSDDQDWLNINGHGDHSQAFVQDDAGLGVVRRLSDGIFGTARSRLLLKRVSHLSQDYGDVTARQASYLRKNREGKKRCRMKI